MDTDRWAVGSDYPFGNNKRSTGQNGNDETVHFTIEHFKKRGYIWNYDKQVELFKQIMGNEKVDATHQAIYDYINTPVEQLAESQVERLENWKHDIKETKHCYKLHQKGS